MHPTTVKCSGHTCLAGNLKANAATLDCLPTGCDDPTCCDAAGVQCTHNDLHVEVGTCHVFDWCMLHRCLHRWDMLGTALVGYVLRTWFW